MTLTTTDPHWLRPDLAYRYEFEPDELEDMSQCVKAHGLAVVKGVIPIEHVEQLKSSIDQVLNPHRDLEPGQTRVSHGFVEFSPPLLKLFDNPAWLAIHERLMGTREMTVHRSAAILKNAGCPAGAWHTDWSFNNGPPLNSGDVLNRGEHPSGKWFYLSGTHPARGGLAVIEDSHRIDWEGPPGFEFTEGRRSFYPRGTEPKAYAGMDVPGVVPLFTDPGDMIIFAARTYHGVFPHNGDEPRYSCALGFRPHRRPWPVPWPMPESARKLGANLPPKLRPDFEHYTSIVSDWRPA